MITRMPPPPPKPACSKILFLFIFTVYAITIQCKWKLDKCAIVYNTLLPKSRLTYSIIVALVLDFLIQSINAISIALIEELKDVLKKDTIYDSEQSVEVKSDNLPGLTSSTKPHPAEWTPWSAILILQQNMMVSAAVLVSFSNSKYRLKLRSENPEVKNKTGKLKNNNRNLNWKAKWRIGNQNVKNKNGKVKNQHQNQNQNQKAKWRSENQNVKNKNGKGQNKNQNQNRKAKWRSENQNV